MSIGEMTAHSLLVGQSTRRRRVVLAYRTPSIRTVVHCRDQAVRSIVRGSGIPPAGYLPAVGSRTQPGGGRVPFDQLAAELLSCPLSIM